MRLALAQINTTIGDIAGNLARMSQAVADARGCDLLVLPELCVTGYPPQDLLEHAGFVSEAVAGLAAWAAALPADAPAALVAGGHVASLHPKTLLPTYDVFDEDRWFEPPMGPPALARIAGVPVGLTVCEDLWTDTGRYATDPVATLASLGAALIVNISASPFSAGKGATRRALLEGHARRHGVALAYVNAVGGNDSLVFDGRSLMVDAAGRVVAEGAAFAEDLLLLDTAALPEPAPRAEPTPAAEVAEALVLGVRDYFRKIGARSAVVGLSGGIDSAVTATVAADALGPAQVVGIAMPSEFSSPGSLEDAEALARNLGIGYEVVPIQPGLEALRRSLGPLLGPPPWGVADENLQARLRGMTLMAFSNRHGHLVLSTGNKSELAVGYCTLYGDMCGGLAVISDVPKTLVYDVARHLNRHGPRIPESTLTKPPSAELRPDQRDDQSLPPYEDLDRILYRYVEERLEIRDIVARGEDRALVERIVRMVDRAEYKRRQMPVGIRVTSRAFGPGRRLPIAQRWTDHPGR